MSTPSKRTDTMALDDDAINWGDLHVVEATLDHIVIEEVSPDAVNLKQWMHDRLVEWGWDVRVETEW